MLANIYLHTLDATLRAEGVAAVRYADDFIVVAGSEADALRVRALLGQTLAQLGLELHAEKTQVLAPGRIFTFLGEQLPGHASSQTAARIHSRPAVNDAAIPAALRDTAALDDATAFEDAEVGDAPDVDEADDADTAPSVSKDQGAAAGTGARTLYVLRQGTLLRCDGERLIVMQIQLHICS